MDKISRFMMTTCRGSGSMSFLSVSRPWSFPSVPEKMKRRKCKTVIMKSDWGVIFWILSKFRTVIMKSDGRVIFWILSKSRTVIMKSDWRFIFWILSKSWTVIMKSDWRFIFWILSKSQYLLRGEGDRRCLEGEVRSDLRLSTGEGLLSYKLKFIFF